MGTGYDLGSIFDQHVAAKFQDKSVDATMDTMVEEPYVWYVPVMTGGAGGEGVREFYSSQFVGQTRRMPSFIPSREPSPRTE